MKQSKEMSRSDHFIYAETFQRGIKTFEKRFISTDGYWLKRFVKEQEFYNNYYSKLCSSINIPTPIEIDSTKSLFLEYIDGTPLALNRYGDNDVLNSELVENLLTSLKQISTLAPEDALESIFDKSYLLSLITKAKDLGVLKNEMLENIEQKLLESNFELAPSHGDFLLKNIIQRNDDLFIIDWEYFGKNVYYWDHAMLWCQLMGKRQLQEQVLANIPASNKDIFLLTAAVVIIKEIRLDLKTDEKEFAKTLEKELQYIYNSLFIQFHPCDRLIFNADKNILDIEELQNHLSHLGPSSEDLVLWETICLKDKKIGYCWLENRAAGVFIGLFISKEYRGSKIGEHTINHLFTEAVLKGLKELNLNVRLSNQIAIRLYQKFEFVEIERNINKSGIAFMKIKKQLSRS